VTDTVTGDVTRKTATRRQPVTTTRDADGNYEVTIDGPSGRRYQAVVDPD